MPNYDALVLTLCINGFDVHRVLVDPSSAADLLQLSAFNKMKLVMLFPLATTREEMPHRTETNKANFLSLVVSFQS